jgi:hypothetical protein
MQKRASPGNKGKLRQNPKLRQLTYVVNTWASLSLDDKFQWRNAANNYLFPDRWGVPRNLTGREFFIKIANYCVNVGNPIPDGDEVGPNDTQVQGDIANITAPGSATLEFYTPVSSGYATIHAYPVPYSANYDGNKYGPIIWGGPVPLNAVIDISTELWGRYPYLQPGDLVSIGTKSVNYYGFPGTSGIVQAVVQ